VTRSRGAIVAAALLAAALAAPGAHAQSSVTWQLDLQYELSHDVPLRDAPWVSTHNSFNSTAEMGETLSAQDSNQMITIVAQLNAGIRGLELDLHNFLPLASGGEGPVVCHARPGDEAHAGCTVEKRLGPVLDEIVAWLDRPENRQEILLLYLEDHLDDETGYDEAASVVSDRLGDRLYRPPAGGCTDLPLDLTRGEIIASGAQAIVVSDCGIGTAWPSVAHSWNAHLEERPFGFLDYPDCGPDFTRAQYELTLIRYYEDSTQLTAHAGTPDDGITPATAAAMARCGVDLIGLDQLTGPADPRLPQLVWSWAPDEPGAGSCALMVVDDSHPFGRWFSKPCGEKLRVACRTAGGGWNIPRKRANPTDRYPCGRDGARFGVPRTGYENQQLREALEAAGITKVWLGYRLVNGRWVALDAATS